MSVDAKTVIDIAEFSIKYGVPAVKSIVETWKKDTITAEDWDALSSAWKKTPEAYLAEAQAAKDKAEK